MKKVIILLSAACSMLLNNVQAQDAASTTTASSTSAPEVKGDRIKSKRGFEILPEADEWALGISASASLNYLGNLMNSNTNNSSAGNAFNQAAYYNGRSSAPSTTIFGKKFIDEFSAYRVRLSIDASSNTTASTVTKDELLPDANYPKFVEDKRTFNNFGLMLALGKEYRRGKGRVQGVYGAEALVGVSKSATVFEHGNAMSNEFTNPTTSLGNLGNGARLKAENNGMNVYVAVRPFIGVEYFFAPKMSIGGEFGLPIGVNFSGKSYQSVERFEFTDLQAKRIENQVGSRVSYFGLNTENLSGAINLMFHF